MYWVNGRLISYNSTINKIASYTTGNHWYIDSVIDTNLLTLTYDNSTSIVFNNTTFTKNFTITTTASGTVTKSFYFVNGTETKNLTLNLKSNDNAYIDDSVIIDGSITSGSGNVYVATTPGDAVGSGVAGDGTNFKQIYGQRIRTVIPDTKTTYLYDGTDLLENPADYFESVDDNIEFGAIASASEIDIYQAFFTDAPLDAGDIAQIESDFALVPEEPTLTTSIYLFRATDFDGIDQYADFGRIITATIPDSSIHTRINPVNITSPNKQTIIGIYQDVDNYLQIYIQSGYVKADNRIEGQDMTQLSVALSDELYKIISFETHGSTARLSADNVSDETNDFKGIPDADTYMASFDGSSDFAEMVLDWLLVSDTINTDSFTLNLNHRLLNDMMNGNLLYSDDISHPSRIIVSSGSDKPTESYDIGLGKVITNDSSEDSFLQVFDTNQMMNVNDRHIWLLSEFRPDETSTGIGTIASMFDESSANDKMFKLSYDYDNETIVATVGDYNGGSPTTVSLTSTKTYAKGNKMVAFLMLGEQSASLYVSDGKQSEIITDIISSRINTTTPFRILSSSDAGASHEVFGGNVGRMLFGGNNGNHIWTKNVIVNTINNMVGWVV